MTVEQDAVDYVRYWRRRGLIEVGRLRENAPNKKKFILFCADGCGRRVDRYYAAHQCFRCGRLFTYGCFIKHLPRMKKEKMTKEMEQEMAEESK